MIDFHSHVIPETIIAAMHADPGRYATRIEAEAGKRYLVRGKLRLAGLVTVRRDGRRAVYAVPDPHVRRLVAEVLHLA